ncbi:transporter [Nitrospira sp. M1]
MTYSQRQWHFVFLVIGCIVLLNVVPLWAQSLEGDRREEATEFQESRDLFLRQEKIVFGQGELLLEFSSLYSSNESQLVNLELKARTWDNAINLQYGLLDGLQFGLQVPVLVNALQETNDLVGMTSIRDEDRGFGDVSGDLRYQLLGERRGQPDVILDVNVKSKTGGQTLRGSGHWNVGGGLTLVKTLDPAVVFARLGYTETVKRNGFNPGNIIEYRFGVGFSLNDRVSLNAQLSGAFLGRSRQRGTQILRSSREVASLLLATTILLDRHFSIEPVIGAGLTDESNDFTFGLRFPYRF